MDQLLSSQELQALASLLSRVPMTPPEQMWVQAIVQRLVAFCASPQPTQPQEEEEEVIE